MAAIWPPLITMMKQLSLADKPINKSTILNTKRSAGFEPAIPHVRIDPLYILRRLKRVVHSNRQVRKDYLFIIAVISTLIFSSSTIGNHGHDGILNVVTVKQILAKPIPPILRTL